MFMSLPNPIEPTPKVEHARRLAVGFMAPHSEGINRFAQRGVITQTLQHELATEVRWFEARPDHGPAVRELTEIREVVDAWVHETFWCHDRTECGLCAQQAAAEAAKR